MEPKENLPGKDPGKNLLIAKIGGNVINNDSDLRAFLSDFSQIKGRKILVHGGGKKATEIGNKLDIKPRYIDGRRITDKITIDLVTMVYGGLVNKQIVASLQALSCRAIGITGADADSIPAIRRPVQEIDYGFVGDIREQELAVDSWQLFLNNDLVPVVAPLTHDGKGQMLNTNADTIASVLAALLAKYYSVRLVYCFDKKGVLKDINDEENIVKVMDVSLYKEMTKQKVLSAGILPKLHNAFRAIEGGANKVLIGHAKDIIRNAGEENMGTLIVS